MSPQLVYQIEGETKSYSLDKDEVTIGRSAENDIVIRDALVSRHHAKIFRSGDHWQVADVGSSNGTRVNDCDPTSHELKSGDRIQLHKFHIAFVEDVAPSVMLTAGALPEVAGSGTVIRSAVDFAGLASMQRGQTTGPGEVASDRLSHLLEIVTKASEALLASSSLDGTLSTVLDLVFEHLNVDRGCIMLWDEEKQDLAVRCVRHRGESSEDIRFSRTIAEKVYRDKVSILTSDALHDDRFSGGQSIVALNIRSAMAAPLWNGDHVEGLIYADTPSRTRAFDNFDLDVLSALGNHAAVAIEQSRLQRSIMEQQLVRQRLERYHSPAVIEHITARGGLESSLEVDELDVTVMFADVVGFTPRCESMEPKAVAELLNRYFSEMAEMIFRHEGTLDKFIGDCMMTVFGAPLATEDHARRAAEAALDMRQALAALNEPLPSDQRMEFRIGMHSGRVVAGDIGSVRRSDYTVLGSTVNLAARLESSVAKAGQIVISAATRAAIGDGFETRMIGEHQPKGISSKTECFELLGRKT